MAGLRGRIFGGYRLADQLSSGGVAEVYRAQPVASGGREAVVKVIYPEFARQPGFLPNFRNIVEMSSRLANHPHILPVLESGEASGYLYLTTPFVSAGTLKEWIAKGGRVGQSDALPLFRQLCDALGYAHSLGIAHGNVKPSNIFLYDGRHVLLGDFGMLWDIRQMDMNHAGSGTEAVEFLAPEVASGQITQLSDVYGVGAVLFTAITGHAPFRGATPGEMFAAHARQPVPHLMQITPNLPTTILALDSVTQRAMAKRPEDRFPAATALAQAMEASMRQAAAQPPQQHPAMQPGMQPPLFGMPAPASAAPGGFGMPSAVPSLGQALGIPALAGAVAPPFKPLDPPFPPLPPTAHVESGMEHGRINFNAPPVLSAPATFEPLQQPTLRVPAPRPPAIEPPPDPTMRVPAPQAAPPPDPTMRVPAPRLPAPPAQFGDDAVLGPQRIPALRLDGPGAPMQPSPLNGDHYSADGGNFVPNAWDVMPPAMDNVVGVQRAGQRHDLDEARWRDETGYDDAADSRTYDVAQNRHDGAGWDDSRELPGWTNDQMPAMSDSMELERPFSATELGLPRLTSPSLSDMPPSWQDLVGGGNSNSQYPGGWDNGDSAQWSVQGLSVHLPREERYVRNEQRKSSGKKAKSAARATPRPRRSRGRMIASLALTVFVVLLGLTSFAVLRPDLCPMPQCQTVSDTAHDYLPFLPASSPTPISTTMSVPASTVAAGAKTTQTITLHNTSANEITWSSDVNAQWLSLSPASGSISPDGAQVITFTMDATTLKAGDYKAAVTITTNTQVLRIPVALTVTAH
ncbi:MAG: hypothetical protein OJF49_004627 [Ktedonobacterales bacterium]|jgi:serine/threonine-protein kinase|nr:MAG: hypothetical protein OJF49_004627 [Ktedonobacterales bacterium]